MSNLNNSNEVELFGVPVRRARLGDALRDVHQAVVSRQPLHIGVVNAAKLVNMQEDEELRKSVLASDVIYADGMAVVWASRILRRSLPERIAGIDLMLGILADGSDRQYKVYCLGASQEVLDRVVRTISSAYPGVQLVGAEHGYFDESGEEQVAVRIRASEPDILFVAITSPKKERFMARWGEHMQVPVCHGVGGSFDVIAGKISRAPVLVRRLGMEWAYRVFQEPRRLWKRYLVTNTKFISMLLRELLRGDGRHRDGVSH